MAHTFPPARNIAFKFKIVFSIFKNKTFFAEASFHNKNKTSRTFVCQLLNNYHWPNDFFALIVERSWEKPFVLVVLGQDNSKAELLLSLSLFCQFSFCVFISHFSIDSTFFSPFLQSCFLYNGQQVRSTAETGRNKRRQHSKRKKDEKTALICKLYARPCGCIMLTIKVYKTVSSRVREEKRKKRR